MMIKKIFLLFVIFGGVVMLNAEEKYFPVEELVPGSWFVNSIQKTRADREKFYLEKLAKLVPDEVQRAARAEAFHRMLEINSFSSNRAEDEAIERALGWKKGDFTWHNNTFYTKTGCTSWIITPDVSATGACMVQKNRDYKGQNLLSARLYRAEPGKYKVITVNDLWSSGAGAVMNEKGLMIVQNDGSSVLKQELPNRSITVGCIFMLRHIAEHCANLDEAVAMLKKFYRTELGRSSSIYLLADLDSGAIIETTGKHLAYAEVNFAYEVRANNYLLPGMRSTVNKKREAFLNGANRRYAASEFLRKVVADKGKIAPFDLMRLARFRQPELEQSHKYRSVCVNASLASTMFVPDRQFPEYLNVAFVALGPQRHTVFLPIPMGLSAMPESLINGDWGSKALALSNVLPLDHQYIPEFETVETRFIDEFFAAREQARKLLVSGKRPEAVKLLDKVFRKQYGEAKQILADFTKKVTSTKEKK